MMEMELGPLLATDACGSETEPWECWETGPLPL